MEEQKPRVSVHMPMYNSRSSLPMAIRSLQLQSFADWEAVIVDDGSTDGSAEYVESLDDARLRLIKLGRNHGRAYARQTALEASLGEYIAYLDSDDFYHPDKLEQQVRFLDSSPQIDHVGCAVGSIDAALTMRRVRGKREIRDADFRYARRFPVFPVASMIRTATAKRGTYRPRIRLGEDTDYFFRVMQDRRIANIPQVSYFYSEYESVTMGKVYLSYYYGLLALPGQFAFRPSHVMLRGFYTLMQMAALPLFVAVKGWDGVISRRGQAPSDEDLGRLTETLRLLQPSGSTET